MRVLFYRKYQDNKKTKQTGKKSTIKYYTKEKENTKYKNKEKQTRNEKRQRKGV